MNEYRVDMKKHPESAGMLSTSQQYTTYTPIDESNSIASINFPCALVASNKTLHLEESSTIFFVLKPEYPGKDDRVCFFFYFVLFQFISFYLFY